jgi:hypothetical protein
MGLFYKCRKCGHEDRVYHSAGPDPSHYFCLVCKEIIDKHDLRLNNGQYIKC